MVSHCSAPPCTVYTREGTHTQGKPLPRNEEIPILYPDRFLKTKILTLKEGGSGEEEDVEGWSRVGTDMASDPIPGKTEGQGDLHS